MKTKKEVDNKKIEAEEKIIESLNQKITRYGDMARAILVHPNSNHKNPFFLSPDDLIAPTSVNCVTQEDLNYARTISQYCSAHARPMCTCNQMPQFKR